MGPFANISIALFILSSSLKILNSLVFISQSLLSSLFIISIGTLQSFISRKISSSESSDKYSDVFEYILGSGKPQEPTLFNVSFEAPTTSDDVNSSPKSFLPNSATCG